MSVGCFLFTFGLLALSAHADEDGESIFGPAYSDFHLTLQSGHREEAVGPLYFSQESDGETQFGLPPFYSQTLTPSIGWSEWNFFYPIIDYRRFGSEYRLQIAELISFSGGKTQEPRKAKGFTIFPIYFQMRSQDTNLNYTALVPFYGELKNRLFRDDVKFIMFPLYSETRKKDVVTDNYLYPIFDLRHGDHLTGWQFWPLFGEEHKTPTTLTNNIGDVSISGGYDNYFVLFPFYLTSRTGLGTTNPASHLTMMPFYNRLRSPLRDESAYGWPLGVNFINDRAQGYVERDVFWPFFVKARGTKTVTRYFPIYSRAHNQDLESDFYAWPIYKFNRLESDPLDRQRMRILFFLYSDIVEKNTKSGEYKRRTDFWPFYTYHRDMDGNERLQVLAPLEPFFPNNRSVPREYSPIWSFWRSERNARTHATSQSLLWNLYRRETTPERKKYSLLFGLIKYQSHTQGSKSRGAHGGFDKKSAQERPKS
ncbi:MAG TPA: hypothetical protein VGO67_09020 [Verrucomicrobiae bacterium]|jgi:hypothetical protein